jgi:hypothetical protein
MVNGNPADELAVLFPAPRTITIAGRVLELKPYASISQSARLRELGGPIMEREDVDGGRTLDAFLRECPEEANALIVAATDLDAQWIAGLSEDDRFELASHLIDLLGPFIARVRLPQWARIYRGRMALLGIGLTASKPSTITDTPIPDGTAQSKLSATLMPSHGPNGATAASAP